VALQEYSARRYGLRDRSPGVRLREMRPRALEEADPGSLYRAHCAEAEGWPSQIETADVIGRRYSWRPLAVSRKIFSACFFASRSTPRSARSNCRYSQATSLPTRWRALATASIPTRSRPTFRRSDWPGFSPRRIAITGSRPNCARTSCSRCTTCSPTRHSRVSILDFVSCRNLLIYLLPEAQAKVISIIHFALRDGGLLLVGDAETVGVADGRFAVISKPQRIYRRVRGARPGD